MKRFLCLTIALAFVAAVSLTALVGCGETKTSTFGTVGASIGSPKPPDTKKDGEKMP